MVSGRASQASWFRSWAGGPGGVLDFAGRVDVDTTSGEVGDDLEVTLMAAMPLPKAPSHVDDLQWTSSEGPVA